MGGTVAGSNPALSPAQRQGAASPSRLITALYAGGGAMGARQSGILAQSVERLPSKQDVRGSSPRYPSPGAVAEWLMATIAALLS
jgi:hypothetical protein